MEYMTTYNSKDGTLKYAMKHEGRDIFTGKKHEVIVESAFVQLPKRKEGKPENILCLSSMAGCPFTCLSCANTIYGGFYGILTPKDIEEQISIVLSRNDNLDKINKALAVEYAFMGIGEPLFGSNVIRAIQTHRALVPDTRFAISTIGARGYVKKLTNGRLSLPVRLELSLHYPNDRLRIQRMFPSTLYLSNQPELNIEAMLDEAEEYHNFHPGKITLNYALIDGLNNEEMHAQELKNLLRNRKDIFYVKVMKPNATSSLVGSQKQQGQVTFNPTEFARRLNEIGVEATYFESKGIDILAGCGMMASRTFRLGQDLSNYRIPEAEALDLGF